MSVSANKITISLLISILVLGAFVYFVSDAFAQDPGTSSCIPECLAGGGSLGACEAQCGNVPGEGAVGPDEPQGPVGPDEGLSFSLKNPLEFDSIEELLDKIAGFLFRISIPLLAIMIIIGAFYLMTAGGNEDKIKTGKKTITWAVIGFVIILLAASIAALIKNLLEG